MNPDVRARAAVLWLFGGLIVVQAGWHVARLGGFALVLALLATVVPLLLPLPGLVQKRRQTYRWATLTLVPAMTWALTELIANPEVRVVAGAVGLGGFLALAALVAALRTLPRSEPQSDISASPAPRAPAGR